MPTNSVSTPRSRILVVDDDEPALALFRAVLEDEGCTIVEARDGVEALEKFDLYHPDLVVLDLMLPRLNGFEISSRLRRNARSRHVPIIMLSGLAERDAKLRALENGVDEFLAKPVERVELVTRVRAALHLQSCQKCREDQRTTIAAARAELRLLRQSLADAQTNPSAYANQELLDVLRGATKTCLRLEELLE